MGRLDEKKIYAYCISIFILPHLSVFRFGWRRQSCVTKGLEPSTDKAQPRMNGMAPSPDDNGRDVKRTYSDNWTALMSAAYQGNADAVRGLLDKCANVNERDSAGGTALFVALRKAMLTLHGY